MKRPPIPQRTAGYTLLLTGMNTTKPTVCVLRSIIHIRTPICSTRRKSIRITAYITCITKTDIIIGIPRQPAAVLPICTVFRSHLLRKTELWRSPERADTLLRISNSIKILQNLSHIAITDWNNAIKPTNFILISQKRRDSRNFSCGFSG